MTDITATGPNFILPYPVPTDGGGKGLEDGFGRAPIDIDGIDIDRYQPPEETPFVRGDGDRHTVDPNDINQGGYGSCGLLATLHSIAQQDPSVIQDMIQDNGDGTYTVTFYEQVEVFGLGTPIWLPVQVTVSGPFEGGAHSGDLAGGEQEIWPAIIEKAYVQHFHPDYANNSDGVIWPGDRGVNPADVMNHILGPGSQTSGVDKIPSSEMSDRLGRGEVVVAWTPPFTDDDGNSVMTEEQQALIDHYGIYGGHAYAVSEVIPAGTVYTDPHTGEQVEATEDIIVLDNPHGRGDVLMPYSDYQDVFGWVSTNPGK